MGYEACVTPPRNQCSNYGFNQNLGDGDFKYCQSSGSNRPYRPVGGSSSYRPAGGSSSYRPGGSSSSSYRPGGSSSSSYRPGRPGGSSSYRPVGNRNPPRRPSLGDILSGVRNGGNSGSSDSSS